MADARKCRHRATRGRYRTRGQAADPHPHPYPYPGYWPKSGLCFRVLIKSQETLYFGDEINGPHTVHLHVCKLHCSYPTRDHRPARLLRPAVIWESARSALPAALLGAHLLGSQSRGAGSEACQPACPSSMLYFFHSLAEAK